MSRIEEKVVLAKTILQYDGLSKKSSPRSVPMVACTYARSVGTCKTCFLAPKLPWCKGQSNCCRDDTSLRGQSVLYVPIANRAKKDKYSRPELCDAAENMREVLIHIYKEDYENVR